MKKQKNSSKKKLELKHYWICGECANSKGLKWPKVHAATCHIDICPYCNEKKTLSSVTDWLKPGEKELKNWD